MKEREFCKFSAVYKVMVWIAKPCFSEHERDSREGVADRTQETSELGDSSYHKLELNSFMICTTTPIKCWLSWGSTLDLSRFLFNTVANPYFCKSYILLLSTTTIATITAYVLLLFTIFLIVFYPLFP